MAIVVVSPGPSAQQRQAAPPCEPRLVKPSPDPFRYKPRGERCEGTYIREVAAAGGLSVVSFTTALPALVLRPGEPLRLEWTASSDRPVTLRAMSLRRRLYYQMDAAPPAGAGRFEWPTDVLVPLGLRMEELGLVAWSRRTIGATAHDVYVPIGMAATAPPTASTGYLFRVVPGTALRELHVTLAAVDASGRDEVVVVRNEPLRRGPYPAERPIAIPLPPLPRPGLYRLQINALVETGAPTSRSLYFEHAGG